MTFAIIATGESLTAQQVARVRGLRCLVVSDAYVMAPWAEALVSGDRAWWRYHMPDFEGRRFSSGAAEGTEKLPEYIPTGTNSGVLAIKVARHLGAKRIILLGYDGHGSHFFGDHPADKRGHFRLKNTSPDRRKVHAQQHQRQADDCKLSGVEIFNCSPGTVLGYPVARLEDMC